MAFHEVRFPARLSFGSIGGPERLTEIVTLANGHEERNTPWTHSRRRYDAGVGVRSLDDVAELIAFFEARRARLHGFRWKDWADFASCAPSGTVGFMDQTIAVGDGATSVFQLSKTYRSGEERYVRPIAKPIEGSARIGLDGVEMRSGAAVEVTTGRVTFDVAPPDGASITAGFQFDVPVRFDADAILISAAGVAAGEIPDVPVVEVRV